ncbi:C-GCAxxG-C-C family protein [bacterium]|nr:C-GCAxxG-C-C family protein [bacterium]
MIKNKNIRIKENAQANFASGFNCAESVLLAIAKELKIRSASVPKVATGFGAGVGKHGDICGALSGAVMAMGIVEGRTNPKDQESKTKIYAKTAILMEEFKKEFGYITCRDLTGCDLLTKEGQDKFSDHKIHEQICTGFVAFAAGKGLELISKNK